MPVHISMSLLSFVFSHKWLISIDPLTLCATGPTITTMIYTYFFIFAAMKRLKSDLPGMDKEYVSALTETLANRKIRFLLFIYIKI